MTEEEAEKLQVGDVVRMKSSEQLNNEGEGIDPDEWGEEVVEIISVQPKRPHVEGDYIMFTARMTEEDNPDWDDPSDDGLREFSGDWIKELIRKGNGTVVVGDTPFERFMASRGDTGVRH